MKERFDQYFEAHESHDIERVLSFLSEDFQLHFTAFNVTIDKTGLVDVLGWDKGAGGTVSYENLTISGDSITGLFTEQNEFLKLIDIPELKANITYSFNKSGLIVKQSYTPLPNQPSSQGKILPALEWAKINNPEELSSIYPNDQMVFNQEMAERWVRLLREWKASQKRP